MRYSIRQDTLVVPHSAFCGNSPRNVLKQSPYSSNVLLPLADRTGSRMRKGRTSPVSENVLETTLLYRDDRRRDVSEWETFSVRGRGESNLARGMDEAIVFIPTRRLPE